jgi:hypothetical protein
MDTTAQPDMASPNYSQFLNLDGSDDGSYSAPSDDLSSGSLSSISSDTLGNSCLEMGYGLNVEPDVLQFERSAVARKSLILYLMLLVLFPMYIWL